MKSIVFWCRMNRELDYELADGEILHILPAGRECRFAKNKLLPILKPNCHECDYLECRRG